MGLFSNDKKPCPICGKGTPKLMATKIADQTPICSRCSNSISMESTQIELLTPDALKEHLSMRQANAQYIESTFKPTQEIEVGMTFLNIDETNKVFTLPLIMCGDTENPPVFQFEELVGYELLAETQVIERYHNGDFSPTYIPIVYRTATRLLDVNAIPINIHCNFSYNLYLSNPSWSKIITSAGASRPIGASKANIYQHLDELQQVTDWLLQIMGAQPRGDNPRGGINGYGED